MKIVDIFILIMTVVGFGVLGAIALTGIRTASSISVGSVNSQTGNSINVPISLSNPGPLSLNGLDVAITILNASGTTLFSGGGGPISLAPGFSGELPISVSLDLNQLQNSTIQTLATTNQNLTIDVVLSASVSSITSVIAAISSSYEWGAPVGDLQVGEISASIYNVTSAKFILPVSFTDESQTLGVNGSISGTILGQGGNILGTISPLSVDVGTQSSFSNQLTGYISSSALTQSTITVQLSFQTSFGAFTEEFVENA